MLRNTDKDWEYYGRNDPYFGVVSWDKFRAKELDPASRAEFFQTGQAYISTIFSIIRKHFDAAFFPASALDFGCGTGRLVIPISERAGQVTGVDVSPSMVEEARKNIAAYDRKNITLLCTADIETSLAAERFDFVHSFIVFQHIDVRRGLKITESLVERLNEGGIGALHYSYAPVSNRSEQLRIAACRHIPYLNNLRNLLKGLPFRDPPMMMNTYPLNKLFGILQARNCEPVHVHFTRHGENGVLLFFQKARSDMPVL